MASITKKGPLAKLMKVFGGSKHERDLKRMHPIVERINELAASYESLSDDALRAHTESFRSRIAEGESLEDLLPEAFATVKDACRRNVGRSWSVTEHEQAWDMIPYDVQLIGGIALHEGKIAEMATGEGKTLVAIFPLYLNGLAGKGAHLVTVNDYLARRDSEWVGEILRWLGLTVGCIQNWMRPDERKEQYACDVTYGTNNEFGFDYLRDNMAVRAEHRVQRPHFYAIVDEVDSVLVDEARTPLIISGPVPHSIQQYAEMKPYVEKLVKLQSRQMTDLVNEAQRTLEKAREEKDADAEYRAGEMLLKVSRGAPKHKRLLKLIADDPSVQKLIQRLEADNLREKTMHVIDEDLYFAIDEKQHTVNISDEAQRATDRALFRVPELSERLDWVDRSADLTEEEVAERRDELLEDVARELTATRGLGGKERDALLEPVREKLNAFAADFQGYVDAGKEKAGGESELELEARTRGLRESTAKTLAEVLPPRSASAEDGDDDADILFDFGWKLDVLSTPRTLEERSAKKEAVHRDYAMRSERIHDIQTLMKAYTLYEKDVEYVVQDGKIMIVDQFTGRLMPGRRFSDGLHQALEAKENVKIEGETQTFATITIQNYFRLYEKLAGMTGTAETEAGEFWEIYELDVVVIPTNRPIQRMDLNDVIYRTRREKYNAVIEEIERLHKLDLPVLVGTVSVEVSETLSRMLKRQGVKHSVLNAKQHQKEAEIVMHAGRPGAVTIATNMAGRGTDIKLSPDIGKTTFDEHETPGGLQVIGTERHESRRIDRQLRGRSGRQGDPGASRFFISLEDDLMRKFATERIATWMERMGAEEGEALEHPMLTKSMERAQKRVEAWNFDIRKRLLEYDNVMNKQREIIYERRNVVLDGGDTKATLLEMIETYVEDHFHDSVPDGVDLEGVDLKPLLGELEIMFLTQVPDDELEKAVSGKADDLLQLLVRTATAAYASKEEQYGEEVMREVERHVMLRVIDEKWRDHLYEIDQLKEGVGWASVGGKDPLLQYKKEAYELFARLDDVIRDDTIKLLMRVQVQMGPPQPQAMPAGQASQAPVQGAIGGGGDGAQRAAALQQRAQAAQAARTARTLDAVVGPRRAREEAEPAARKPSAPPIVGGGAGPSPTEAFPTPAAGGESRRPSRQVTEKVGRNDPCPCGSGKKYKKCHGR